MIVTVLDDFQDAVRHLQCFAKLDGHEVTVWNDHTDDLAVLSERLKTTEALVLIRERSRMGRAKLACMPRLKIVNQKGPCPNIDLQACTERGIIVSADTASNHSSFATAELTWGLIIAALRHIPQEAAALKAGRWQTSIGTGLRGRTMGIYGYGRIGAIVAGYAKAFGMQVLVWGREGSRARAQADGFTAATSRSQFFEQCDVVSLHVSLNDNTRSSIGAADLARMKASALFVNTSRAALVETGALASALKAGRPGMAAVDVFEEEPLLDGNHPLLELDNAICTPHLGYTERDVYEKTFAGLFDQILAYAARQPVNVLNPEVLARVNQA